MTAIKRDFKCRRCGRPRVPRQNCPCGYRPPVGQVIRAGRGWGVRRWWEESPLFESLATKGEAFKLLYALTHSWSSITLTFAHGHTQRFDLREYWPQGPMR